MAKRRNIYHHESDNLQNPVGELPELLLNANKWIWGQEDVNYPTGKGSAKSGVAA